MDKNIWDPSAPPPPQKISVNWFLEELSKEIIFFFSFHLFDLTLNFGGEGRTLWRKEGDLERKERGSCLYEGNNLGFLVKYNEYSRKDLKKQFLLNKNIHSRKIFVIAMDVWIERCFKVKVQCYVSKTVGNYWAENVISFTRKGTHCINRQTNL